MPSNFPRSNKQRCQRAFQAVRIFWRIPRYLFSLYQEPTENQRWQAPSQAYCSKVSCNTSEAAKHTKLESQAAVLASRKSKIKQEESAIKFKAVKFFSDSTIALAWLQSPLPIFKPLMSSWVGEVQINFDPSKGRHIRDRWRFKGDTWERPEWKILVASRSSCNFQRNFGRKKPWNLLKRNLQIRYNSGFMSEPGISEAYFSPMLKTCRFSASAIPRNTVLSLTIFNLGNHPSFVLMLVFFSGGWADLLDSRL